MGLVGTGPCLHGRLHRDGRRVLCFADWSKEYGVPAWTSRNGFVKNVIAGETVLREEAEHC